MHTVHHRGGASKNCSSSTLIWPLPCVRCSFSQLLLFPLALCAMEFLTKVSTYFWDRKRHFVHLCHFSEHSTWTFHVLCTKKEDILCALQWQRSDKLGRVCASVDRKIDFTQMCWSKIRGWLEMGTHWLVLLLEWHTVRSHRSHSLEIQTSVNPAVLKFTQSVSLPLIILN